MEELRCGTFVVVGNVSNLLSLRLIMFDEAWMTGESSSFNLLPRLRNECDLLWYLDSVCRVDPVDEVSMPYWCVSSCLLHVHDLVILLCNLRWLVQFGLR